MIDPPHNEVLARWTTGRQPKRWASARLLCLPFAGGTSSAFNPWRACMPASIELCPIQLPGRQNRLAESPPEDLISLAETLSDVLQPLFDLPFAIFGHSMGALLGYELARRLRSRAGLSPAHLIVSGSEAPQVPGAGRHLEGVGDDELVERAEIPGEIRENPEVLALVLPALRADIMMCARYVYEPGGVLDCPVSALGGHRDPQVPTTSLDKWQIHTTGAFERRVFPGEHLYLLQRPEDVAAVATQRLV